MNCLNSFKVIVEKTLNKPIKCFSLITITSLGVISDPNNDAENIGLNTGQIVGIVIGVVVFIAIIVSIVFYIWRGGEKTKLKNKQLQHRDTMNVYNQQTRLYQGGSKILKSLWKKVKKFFLLRI